MSQQPAFTNGLELDDTDDTDPNPNARVENDETTKRTSLAQPAKYVAPDVLPGIPGTVVTFRSPSWLHRLRLRLMVICDPRSAEEKLAERRIIESAVDAYRFERKWHRSGLTAFCNKWTDAKNAIEANTGSLLRARGDDE